MANCRELIEFLDDYLSNRLDGDVRATFDAHLDACPDCRTYLQTYQQTIHLCRCSMHDTKLPPLPESLVQAILAARSKSA